MKEDEVDEACSAHGGDEKCIQSLVGRPKGKRPLRGPGCKKEDNIKMDLREVGFEGMDWIYLTQNRDLQRTLVNKEFE
jgi:hypothetical protein